MNALAYSLSDSATMLRRQLRHMVRYPSLTMFVVGMPVIFLLLFVFVFGGTLGAGLGGAAVGSGTGGGRAAYLEYVTPGILVMTIAAVVQGTAISVAMDMTGGIVARFRTMSISRGSVLTGHVLGSMVQAAISIAVLLAVAVLLGFRPSAGPMEWLGVIGVLAIASFALTWLAVALGMVTNSVETASNLPMPLVLLPFLGSGFVPTDSMPGPLKLFAEFQPFTPIIETLRGLLTGTSFGNGGILAVAWCASIAAVSYLWAMRLYERHSVH
ncbi:MAG TPA: ABC transporter permease [Candidatus Limnocylindrales bacterium]